VLLAGLLFLTPFYFILTNAVKPFGAIVRNAASWPETFHYQNFVEAWRVVDMPRALLNSFLVTSISIAGMVVMGSMAAWRMVRRPHRLRWSSRFSR